MRFLLVALLCALSYAQTVHHSDLRWTPTQNALGFTMENSDVIIAVEGLELWGSGRVISPWPISCYIGQAPIVISPGPAVWICAEALAECVPEVFEAACGTSPVSLDNLFALRTKLRPLSSGKLTNLPSFARIGAVSSDLNQWFPYAKKLLSPISPETFEAIFEGSVLPTPAEGLPFLKLTQDSVNTAFASLHKDASADGHIAVGLNFGIDFGSAEGWGLVVPLSKLTYNVTFKKNDLADDERKSLEGDIRNAWNTLTLNDSFDIALGVPVETFEGRDLGMAIKRGVVDVLKDVLFYAGDAENQRSSLYDGLMAKTTALFAFIDKWEFGGPLPRKRKIPTKRDSSKRKMPA